MAPKSSNKVNTVSQPQAHVAQTHDALVFAWARQLYDAIKQESQYALAHDELFKEFDRLCEAAQSTGNNKVTMINHVAPIYNHLASQGYQPKVHYVPLKTAVFNFCQRKPVADWIGPPDQFSRSPTPRLEASQPLPTQTQPPPVSQPATSKSLPTSKPRPTSKPVPPPTSDSPANKPPPPPKIARMTVPKSGPKQGSSKKRKPTSSEFVRSDQDELDRESAKGPPLAQAPPPTQGLPPARGALPSTLPSTDGMDKRLSRCQSCEQRGHGCHVNPKASTLVAACFECNHWKQKCSHAPNRRRRGEVPAQQPQNDDEESTVEVGKSPLEIEQERAEDQPAPKPRQPRKKPTQIPAGKPGQYGGRLI